MKCTHCGEFVDGRASTSGASGGQTVNFVIDKAVFNGEQPVALEGGPRENIAGLLTDQTQESIAAEYSNLSDEDTTPFQPAPDAASGEESSRAVLPSSQVPASSESPPDTDAENDDPDDLEVVDGEVIDDDESESEASDESKFAKCSVCGTEVLVEDNFCFHCGSLRRKSEEPEKSSRGKGKTKKSRRAKTKKPHRGLKRAAKSSSVSNSAYYFLIGALGIAIAVLGIFQPVQFTYWRWEVYSRHFIFIFTPVSLLLIVAAYFRKRNFMSLLRTTAVTGFWVLCFAAALLGRAYLGMD